MSMSPERIAEGDRATARAKVALKQGDRLLVTRCGGGLVTVTFYDWDYSHPKWIMTRTLTDVHALHIRKVNGVARTFQDPKPEAAYELLDAAMALDALGWFRRSRCASREQNEAMARMRAAIRAAVKS